MYSALKWLLFLPLFIFFFLFLKTSVNAAENYQAPPASNQYLTPATNPDVPKNMHTYTQSVVIELMSAAVCQLAGYDPLSKDHKCLGVDPTTNKIGFVENGGGMVGAMGSLIAMTYSMPTSTSQYADYLAGNFGLTKKAFAANACTNDADGAGFCSVKPLTGIWVGMRDIVYLLFTVVFVLIGLAIMLRVHIDPRTVMTIENQIPKIIVGIIMVTFSLAIAGLLIDIMYVAIYLIGNVLSNVDSTLTTNIYNDIATASNPFNAVEPLRGNTDIVHKVAESFANTIIGTMFNGAKTPFTVDLVLVQWDLGQVLLFLFLWIVFLLALVIALFRVWITLIMAYIMILMNIIFAPFWFLAGLLPGGSLGVGAWFREMLANLAVFPTTIAMIALAFIFSNIGNSSAAGALFSPPLAGKIGDVGTLGGLITFGFIFMTPQALSLVKAAIKAPKLNVGPVFAPAGAAAGALRSGASGAIMTQSTIIPKAETKYGFTGVLKRRIGAS